MANGNSIVSCGSLMIIIASEACCYGSKTVGNTANNTTFIYVRNISIARTIGNFNTRWCDGGSISDRSANFYSVVGLENSMVTGTLATFREYATEPAR